MGETAIITINQQFNWIGLALAIGKPFNDNWQICFGFLFWSVEIELKKKTKENKWFKFHK